MMYGETCRGSADAPTYRPDRICLHVQIVVLGTELIYTITQLSQSQGRLLFPGTINLILKCYPCYTFTLKEN